MFSAATRMIIVSTRNITLRSTASALKKVMLRCFQVLTCMPAPASAVTGSSMSSTASGFSTITSIWETPSSITK